MTSEQRGPGRPEIGPATTVRLPADMHARLAAAAAETGASKADVVRDAVADYLAYGVIRPTSDGRWWAAAGLGSRTRELGVYPTAEEARDAAGGDGRTVIEARLGETGWGALAREHREREGATWMVWGSSTR